MNADVTPQRASTRRVFARYLAFEAPSWVLLGVVLAVLMRGWGLTLPVAALVLGLWVLKDLALFPFVRKAYETRGGGGGAEALVGALGTAQDRLDPEGWVRLGHERWRARARGGSIEKDLPVRVREVRGLVLVVEPAEPVERG